MNARRHRASGGAGLGRLAGAWRELNAEQRLAAVGALALLLTMFLPWYQQNAVDRAGIVSQDLNAFAVFSVLEASILIAVLAVLALLFARAERRFLVLPGSADGGIVLGAGAWACFVLVLRLFDKPGVESHGIAADVGVQWGIFFALAAAGLLAYAGSRMRAARSQAPLIRAARARTADAWSERERPDRDAGTGSPPRPGEEVTVISPTRPPGRGGPAAVTAPPQLPGGSVSADAAARAQQLSFDDETQVTEAHRPPPEQP